MNELWFIAAYMGIGLFLGNAGVDRLPLRGYLLIVFLWPAVLLYFYVELISNHKRGR
jgi:hypothetical protein